ncbi:MAG: 1-phosphofructokinase family hexose kinase [Devosia sp.]
MARILTLTLNPALDISTAVPDVVPQRKLRCATPRFDPGGGGVNVSRVIKELGGQSTAFLTSGGRTGPLLVRMLRAAGVETVTWSIRGDTRFSLMVMEEHSGLQYRFVMPGPEIPESNVRRMLVRIGELIGEGDYVVASGSLAASMPVETYGMIANLARSRGARLILDTHGEALRSAIEHRPYLVRLNHLEAQELIGGDGASSHLLAAELVKSGRAEAAIVTFGGEGAVIATAEGVRTLRPPRVEVRSMVGAGDSFVGALTLSLAEGSTVLKAARHGVAAAAAAVTTEATELCKAPLVAALLPRVTDDVAAAA